MSEYIVTSGSHTVTKDGTPLGGSPYADDVTALQAAHDDGVATDVLKLAQFDASTKFELGAAEQLLMSKGMPVEGIIDAGVKPAITGGKLAVEFDGVGEDASFKDIKVEDGAGVGLLVRRAANVNIDGVEVETDTAQGRNGDNPEPNFIGCLIGGSTYADISDGEITGNVLVTGYKSNLESGADDNDPYAGERQKCNPAPIANGGAWPGSGFENPDGWRSWSLVSVRVRGNVKYTGCETRNHTVHGTSIGESLSACEIVGNKERSWYGIHTNGVSSGGYSFMLLNGYEDMGLLDAVYRGRHGYWLAKDNETTVLGRTRGGGILLNWRGGAFRPHSAVCQQNSIIAADQPSQIGYGVVGADRALLARNVFEGSGVIGFLVGLGSGLGSTFGTRNPVFLNNDFSAWTSLYRQYYIYPSVQGAHIYPSGSVLDQGTRTRMFG